MCWENFVSVLEITGIFTFCVILLTLKWKTSCLSYHHAELLAYGEYSTAWYNGLCTEVGHRDSQTFHV